MKFLLGVIVLSFFVDVKPIYAGVTSDRLEEVGRQLLSIQHTEYRRCLTTLGYNCADWNEDYKEIEAHGPSIADTLAWIGDQLTTRKLVNLYRFRGCKIAVDMTEGAPASLTWQEEKEGKLRSLNRPVITPERDKEFKADWLTLNGHYTYLKKDHRENGNAQSPKKLIFFNDAALIDLTRIRETKSHVVTDEKDRLVLRDNPASAFRFNFFPDDSNHIVGTQFDDEASIFTVGPSLFPNVEKVIDIFDDQYVPFKTNERETEFKIMLTTGDVAFALNIAKAFRHVIELCELESN